MKTTVSEPPSLPGIQYPAIFRAKDGTLILVNLPHGPGVQLTGIVGCPTPVGRDWAARNWEHLHTHVPHVTITFEN